MIQDNSLVLSAAQAVTTSAPSTNIIDLGATGTPYAGTVPLVRNLGKGEPVAIAVAVTQAFVGPTSVTVSLQASPDAVNWTSTTTGQAVPVASLVAGYQFNVPSGFDLDDNQRYVRLYYTVNGTATAGAINAEVVAGRQTNLSFGGQ